jgi:ketosteroid isomerase-like protein
VNRSRSIVLAGIGAALLCNYWVLEGVLAMRSDPAASWISDLAASSEVYGWRFELLEIASDLAVAAFALLLVRRLGGRSALIRRGLVALFAAGVLSLIGGAAPLDCAETLDPSCSLHYGAIDVIHAITNVASDVATGLAFVLVGVGLLRLAPRSAAGRITLTLGALWLLLTVVTGLSYLSGDVDSVKGLFQRGGQVVFGVWLVALGIWAARPRHAPQSPRSKDNRPMPSGNVEIVRSIYAAWNDGFAGLLDPAIEWVNPPEAVEGGTHHGIEAFEAAAGSVNAAFEGSHVVFEEFIEAGERVVVLGTLRGRGRGSGVEVERPQGYVWTIRDGRAVRFEWYPDQGKALEAAGLPRRGPGRD